MKKRMFAIFMVITMLLLAGCGNKNSDSKSSNDYSTYAGAWISDEASMDITYNNNDIINLSFFLPNHDGSRIASINLSVLIASIVDNSVTMAFEDSWRTSGTVILTFKKDNIIFEIKNITPSGDMWGVYEGVFEFSRDDSQNSIEEEESYIPAPTYDMSKASGILASLGMTEEEFRESCQKLGGGSTSQNPNPIHTRDLQDYPSKYVGQHFYDSGFEVTTKGVSNDGYTTYKNYQCEMLLFDMRDDIYSPTISQGDYLQTTYMIYTGVQTLNGIDFACFRLIAIDRWN
ncbi:MAG: hypothetical protein IKW59_05970 [Clostridia bacterium]|nr:hypothetical protein [Clostridia bacterium]